METTDDKRKKQIRICVIILIVLLVIALAGGGIFAYMYYTSPEYKLGVKLKEADGLMAGSDYDGALAAYNTALTFDPRSVAAYNGIVQAYISKGDWIYDADYNQAMVFYRKASDSAEIGYTASGDYSFASQKNDIENMILTKHQHDSGTWTTVREATCTEEGLRECRCNSCNEVIDSKMIELVAHTPGDWETETEPDCTHAGVRIKKCTVCGEVVATEELPELLHEPGDWVVEKESTCSPGLQVRRCTSCGEVVESEEIPPTKKQHTKDNWETTVEPGCETEGERVRKCKVCGEVLETEVLKPTGHDTKNSSWEIYEGNAVNIDGNQLKVLRCKNCNKIIEPENIARMEYLDSLSVEIDDTKFSSVSVTYDDKGKIKVSFVLNEAYEMTDFGYLLINEADLSTGRIISYNDCRNHVTDAKSDPSSITPGSRIGDNKGCSITDSEDAISSTLDTDGKYFYRVFYIVNDSMIISDIRSFKALANE